MNSNEVATSAARVQLSRSAFISILLGRIVLAASVIAHRDCAGGNRKNIQRSCAGKKFDPLDF